MNANRWKVKQRLLSGLVRNESEFSRPDDQKLEVYLPEQPDIFVGDPRLEK